MTKQQFKIGDPVRLIDNKDHEHIPAGTVGIANTVVTVDKTYLWFMPSTDFQIYIMDADRFELVPEDEAKELGFEGLTPEIPEDLEGLVERNPESVTAYVNQ